MTDLAAVVEKPDAGAAIAALREAGIYDSTRRVVERDDTRLEVPVVEPPAIGAVSDRVVEQADPVARVTGLDDLLAARGWSDAEIGRAPRSWAVIGDAVVVRIPGGCPRPAEVGEALLDLQGCRTALARNGVSGPLREPDVEVIAGDADTEVVHTEHGTRYALDLSAIMFSPGNQAERVRMGDAVEPGTRTLDMFAGIGYFSLPMARAGAVVTAVERNPEAFRYLVENVPLNGVEERVSPIRGDCREVAEWLADSGRERFDRVVMGHYDALDYLAAALPLVRDGGVLTVHAVAPDAEPWGEALDRIEVAGRAAGRPVEVDDRRRVKGYSEGMVHVAVDVVVDGAGP